MKNAIAIAAACLLAALSGCGSRNDNYAPEPPPDTPQPMQFTSFVTAQYAGSATGETQTAVEVESTEFVFRNDDATAFDGIIAAAP